MMKTVKAYTIAIGPDPGVYTMHDVEAVGRTAQRSGSLSGGPPGRREATRRAVC
jgi:hypothetical protein